MEQINFAERRKNFMEDSFHGDVLLTKQIPDIAAQLFYDEFGINIHNQHQNIPITFVTAWKEILKFIGKQQSPEFSIDICGVVIEYLTELSESDKSTNIVPQLYHKKSPIFTKNQIQQVAGSNQKEEMLNNYNSWRSVNLTETVDKIERDTFSILLKDYGIDFMTTAAIFPIISAVYAAGLELAKTSRVTINMYNVFEIDVADGDKIILSPLAAIKQAFKNDSKKL